MSLPSSDCIRHEGDPKRYQGEALSRYYIATGMEPVSWSWVEPSCRTTRCLYPEHMRFNTPQHLAYPSHVCIYCGRTAFTKDHLLPRGWSGEARRRFVAVVPSCGTCNTLLGDTLTWSITERREIAHSRIRRKYAKLLRVVEFGKSDLAELGPTLRASVEHGMSSKQVVLDMLAWPGDPAYDIRALEHSGIEDPYEIGLLIDKRAAQKIAREVA